MINYKKLWWGDHHPSTYISENSNGEPCGVGVAYMKHPQDAVFNLWLWQLDFKTPAEMQKVSMNKQINTWGYAKKYSDMLHNGIEIGVEALGTPERFAEFVKGTPLTKPEMSVAR